MKYLICSTCGIEFGVGDDLHAQRKKDGKNFYCPNGHEGCLVNNRYDKLKKELEDVKKSRDLFFQRSIRRANKIKRLTRQRTALRGVITKMQKKLYPERYKE